jgi:hypothetical protein
MPDEYVDEEQVVTCHAIEYMSENCTKTSVLSWQDIDKHQL